MWYARIKKMPDSENISFPKDSHRKKNMKTIFK